MFDVAGDRHTCRRILAQENHTPPCCSRWPSPSNTQPHPSSSEVWPEVPEQNLSYFVNVWPRNQRSLEEELDRAGQHGHDSPAVSERFEFEGTCLVVELEGEERPTRPWHRGTQEAGSSFEGSPVGPASSRSPSRAQLHTECLGHRPEESRAESPLPPSRRQLPGEFQKPKRNCLQPKTSSSSNL